MTAAENALSRGRALLKAGDLPEAIAEFHRALQLDPAHEPARYALGCAWLEAGEPERVREILTPLAMIRSEFAARAGEKIAQAESMGSAPRAAPGYVRHLFDQFASDYDRRMLTELSYRAHLALRDLAGLLLQPQPHALDILDLGCGTGLAGVAFQDLAHRLDGIDLSPRMIDEARARGIYDALAVADLEVALALPERAYDLILAADTLVYLGDLSAVFAGVRARLKAGGFFLFTVEKGSGEGFERGPKRRYRHSESYLRREAARAGLEVMGLLEGSLRDDAQLPVEGLAAALQCP
jgi:predicted TPR repeat methyltransferase